MRLTRRRLSKFHVSRATCGTPSTMAQGIEAWYYGLPQLTRFYLSVCFLFTSLSALGLLNPRSLYLDYGLVWERFQLWRLPTSFMFLGGFSFPFLMQLMILCVAECTMCSSVS